MKLIAFYLPQFHPIKENNEWWGKGFTEWTNVTKSKALFEGHFQPQLPTELGFYDLRVPEVMEEQAKLAKEYGIDAFCYYHYWFNGNLLLEKPVQQMLNNPNVDIDFCMCWANENWTRRWDGRESQVLMAQNYDEYDANEHMEWLLPYFKDSRYIKINNKPVLLVYRAMDILNMKDIINKWNHICIEAGFDGIYAIAANTLYNKLSYSELLELGFDAIYNFEPNSYSNESLEDKGLIKTQIYNYKKYVETSLSKKWDVNTKIFPTVFPNWDNTARREEDSIVIQNENINDYTYWLYKSMEKVQHLNDEEQIVFINAWNEWAEGAHLEPDIRFGRLNLEATSYAKNTFTKKQFDYNYFSIENNHAELERILIDINRPILIWGTGTRGKNTFKYLPESANFLGFIDSDVNKRNQKIEGANIYCWSIDKHELLKETPVILIASSFESEIVDELEKVGLQSGESFTNFLYVNQVNNKVLALNKFKKFL